MNILATLWNYLLSAVSNCNNIENILKQSENPWIGWVISQAPADWFIEGRDNSLWVTGYNVLNTREETTGNPVPLTVIDFQNVRAIVFSGKVQYIETTSEVVVPILDGYRFDFGCEHKESPDGVYLLLLTPCRTNGEEEPEAITRARLQVVTSLLAAFNGRNMVYKRIFDNQISLNNRTISFHSPAFMNPNHFPDPDPSLPRLTIMQSAEAALNTLVLNDKNKVLLSLRWLESALYDAGVDAFIKYWIALETLALPEGDTNVRHLNEILVRVYQLSSIDEARQQFGTGKLHGLRSNIVHNGKITPIRFELLQYLEALYVDVLCDFLGLQSEHRSRTYLSNCGFDVLQHIDALLRV